MSLILKSQAIVYFTIKQNYAVSYVILITEEVLPARRWSDAECPLMYILPLYVRKMTTFRLLQRKRCTAVGHSITQVGKIQKYCLYA